MANIKTDYKDDVLDTSVNTQRKYQMNTNEDGTVSFVDVTEYLQTGDSFGAVDINATNTNIVHCYSLKNATRLAQGTDLHDLIDYKNYYCNDADDAATMKNCPITNQGFTYRFERTTSSATGTWGLATIVANNGSEYIAVRQDGEWNDWVCIRTAAGKVPLATALATARTIRTNLASTSTASFDGTANIAPGVTGTLPIANGGTGQTTAVDIIKNVLCNSGKNAAPEYVFGFNSGYEGGGYTTIANLKNTLGAATEVYGTLKEPTSYTDYGVSFVGGTSSGDKSLMQTTGFIVGTLRGTTSAEGRTVLTLGNNKAAGEDGNKYGAIAMYDTTANRVVLKPNAGEITATRTFSFPNKSGIVAITSDLSSYLPLKGGTISGNIASSAAGSNNIGTSSNYFAGVFTAHVGNRKGKLWIETATGVDVHDENNSFMPITASNFNYSSSRKVKENIVDITDDEAKKILDVNVVSFDYIDKVGGRKNQYGVIAEDVYKQIPFAVTMPEDYDESSDDIYNIPLVDYNRFVPYLIKMVQLQNKRIDSLQEEINLLKV